MTTFAQAVRKTPVSARTANGMKAQKSTTNPVVDFFFKAGAMRGQDPIAAFAAAFASNKEQATRVALWARDAREGAGERETFRQILRWLEKTDPKTAARVLLRVPELGRWDDVLCVETLAMKEIAYLMVGEALQTGDGLCAKWMPRQGAQAAELRRFFGMTPKQWRKTLVQMTNVVEQRMCAKDWSNIEYSHVPSLAMSRYNRAFSRNDAARFLEYKNALVRGDKSVKINAGAVYPYDIVKAIRTAGVDVQVAAEQWKALPNYVGEASILPVVDVSGSMMTPVGGNLQAIDVSISLGLYLADKNRGPFKDVFCTFSEKPKLEVLKGNIVQKIAQLQQSDWGMNTNLNAVFDHVLKLAVANDVAQKDMPQYILIMSDMQFDQCICHDDSAMEMIQRKYTNAGYEVPKVVFWNINAYDNVPVSFNAKGVALVSGFSPVIVRSILSAKNVTPEAVMLETIMSDRYAF